MRQVLSGSIVLGAALGLAALSCPVAAQPAADPVEAASQTFIHGCVAHLGAYDQLRRRLQPGQDLYLPQLPAKEAGLFLQGREGEAYARPDAGVTMALLPAEAQCAVFVRKASSDRLFKRLEHDLRTALGQSFTVQQGGRETKGALLSRYIDMTPKGEYRAELVKRHGGEPNGLRVILTSSETANPNLQAIITIGTRQP
jgi:hypothetical protein